MSHCESTASGVDISRQAPSSERATTLKSAKTVARPPARPSSRTARMPAAIVVGARHRGILGATLGAVKALLYSNPSSCTRAHWTISTPHARGEAGHHGFATNCSRPLAGPTEVAWECECGVRVQRPGLLRGILQARGQW